MERGASVFVFVFWFWAFDFCEIQELLLWVGEFTWKVNVVFVVFTRVFFFFYWCCSY